MIEDPCISLNKNRLCFKIQVLDKSSIEAPTFSPLDAIFFSKSYFFFRNMVGWCARILKCPARRRYEGIAVDKKGQYGCWI